MLTRVVCVKESAALVGVVAASSLVDVMEMKVEVELLDDVEESVDEVVDDDEEVVDDYKTSQQIYDL